MNIPLDSASPQGVFSKRLASFKRFKADGRLRAVVIFLPPALLLFTFFVVLPLFDASYYSMFKWNGYGSPDNFVGAKNFKLLMKHSVFQHSLWNTGKIILVSLLVQLPLALGLALLIYRKSWSNNIFRLIFFLPYILAEVASGLIWSFILDGDYGIASYYARWTDSDSIYILASREWAFTAILVVIVWKYFGFHMMLFIAGLQGVSEDVLEAAQVDGASPLQVVRHVKLPLLMPSIKMSIFFAVLGSLQIFDIIIPLTNGGPSNLTHSIVTYLYTFGMARLKIGFGNAVAVVLFVICMVYALIYSKTALRKKKEG